MWIGMTCLHNKPWEGAKALKGRGTPLKRKTRQLRMQRPASLVCTSCNDNEFSFRMALWRSIANNILPRLFLRTSHYPFTVNWR